MENTYDGGSLWSEIQRHYRGIVMAMKGTRTNLKPVVRNILKNIGDKRIASLKVVRTPITKMYSFFVKKINKKLNFNGVSHDKLFHLYLVASYEDDDEYVVEKNQNINIRKYVYHEIDESMTIGSLSEPLTLNIMLGKTIEEMGKDRVLHYDAFGNNCQRFVLDMLEVNNIEVSDELREFILQDVSNIVPSWIERVVQIATDIVNRTETAIEGEGVMKKV